MIKIKDEPNKERFVLINKSRKDIEKMLTSLISNVRDYQTRNELINNYISKDLSKTHYKILKLDMRLNKLLVSDIEIHNSENNPRNILFHEAYQLK